MRYFAKLDPQGIVEQVIVTRDDGVIPGRIRGERWVETWTRNGENKNYAGIGNYFDPHRKAFIGTKPFASWVLDETTGRWKSPVGDAPSGPYYWDEPLKKWVRRG